MTVDARNPFIPFVSSNPIKRRICSHGRRQVDCTEIMCKIEVCELNHEAFAQKCRAAMPPSAPAMSPQSAPWSSKP